MFEVIQIQISHLSPFSAIIVIANPREMCVCVLFFVFKKPNIPHMAFLGKFPSICKEDRRTGTGQCVVDTTTVYKSSGKAINSKIHKYSWYHIARQYPRPFHRQGSNVCKEK